MGAHRVRRRQGARDHASVQDQSGYIIYARPYYEQGRAP
jgi:hypothetical protein